MIDNQKYSIILPGRIVEYFPETQTATIQISAETIFSNTDSISEVKVREPIEDVPVHTPSGGGWSLTMEISEGDTCLILFSQIGYDHWLYKDEDEAGTLAGMPKPWLGRQFHEDDGFAFVGFNTLPRAIKDYSTDGSQWRNEDATQNIHLKKDLSITITSPVSVTINAPSVVVNCETSEVNAKTSTLVNCPTNEVTGDLKVGGALEVVGETSGSSMVMSGSAKAVSFNGVIVEEHTHLDAEDRPTKKPT